jgi:hypothetical protein
VKCFCVDLTATILGYNRKTIDRYFNIFRERIFEYEKQMLKPFLGEVEFDESYFGAKRVRGKRGRGAAGKTPVFGVLKRNENVFISIVAEQVPQQFILTAAELISPKGGLPNSTVFIQKSLFCT